MKKKLLLPLMAFVCAITCAFGLAACNNGDEDVSDLFAAKAENAEKVKSVDVGSFIYGEDAAIDEALGDLKFYKKLMNGTYKEVAASDMTVEYRKSSENKTLSAKPEKYTAGDYQLTYGLEGVDQTCDAYFCVEKATSKDFTVTLSKTTWKYGDASATAEIKNPSNIAVQQAAEYMNENDTDYSGIQLFGIKKSVYDGRPSAYKTYSALTTNETDETKPNYPYNKYFGEALVQYYPETELGYGFMQGEYVLIACIQETYNYKEIVCETTFTVTDPETPYGKTFVLTDLTVHGEGGSAAPANAAAYWAQKKTENLNKTAICPAAINGKITGTCDFGSGSFNDLTDDNALKLLKFGRGKDEYNEKDPVYVFINNGYGDDAEKSCKMEGQFYGGKLYLTLQQWTDDETPIPYFLHFVFTLQTED